MPHAAPPCSVRKAWPPSFSMRVILPGSTPDFFVKVRRRLHHRSRDRLILVAGEEIDIVRGEACDGVDGARFGQLLRPLGRGGRVWLAPVGLHAAVKRLRGVLRHGGRPERKGQARTAFGAGIGAARDDAGADDVARMRHLDLHRHESARRQARDRALREIGAELRQRLGRKRSRGNEPRRGANERQERGNEARRSPRPDDAGFAPATPLARRNFFEGNLPHGSKTSCIARTWV